MENTHTEKIKIFDEYFREEGCKSFQEWFEGSMAATEFDTMIEQVFAACDLVQKEQQKRIAEKADINLKDPANSVNVNIKNFKAGSVTLNIDKASILSENNLIK